MDRILENLHIISKYKRAIDDFKNKIFLAYLEIFWFNLVFRLRGTIVAPPIMVQSKCFFSKISILSITNNEIIQNSKSAPQNSHSCVPLSECTNNLKRMLSICFKKEITNQART